LPVRCAIGERALLAHFFRSGTNPNGSQRSYDQHRAARLRGEPFEDALAS
jgi:hypothetical protein